MNPDLSQALLVLIGLVSLIAFILSALCWWCAPTESDVRVLVREQLAEERRRQRELRSELKVLAARRAPIQPKTNEEWR